jgi:hypothetical protein
MTTVRMGCFISIDSITELGFGQWRKPDGSLVFSHDCSQTQSSSNGSDLASDLYSRLATILFHVNIIRYFCRPDLPFGV